MVNDMTHNEKSNACNLLLKKVRVVRIRLLRKSNVPKGELRWLLTPRILKNIYKRISNDIINNTMLSMSDTLIEFLSYYELSK